MSAGKATNQDFELNLAPVIDCFTVLIAFIMVSTTYAAIGIMDAGVAAGGESKASATPPPVQITVEMKVDRSLRVKVSGKANRDVPVAPLKGEGGAADWNHKAMNEQLAGLRASWPAVGVVTLVADNTIPYKDVIGTMEAVRKTMPSILLGGF